MNDFLQWPPVVITSITTVSSKIVDFDGNPLFGAQIHVRENPQNNTFSDDDGSFILQNVLPIMTLVVNYQGNEVEVSAGGVGSEIVIDGGITNEEVVIYGTNPNKNNSSISPLWLIILAVLGLKFLK